MENTGKGRETGFGFGLGCAAGTYYIDHVLLTDGTSSGGGATAPITV